VPTITAAREVGLTMDRGGREKQVSDGTDGEGRDPRLSVHAMSTRNWSLAQDLDLYERLGVRRICVALPKLAQAGIDNAVEAITSRGLQVDGIYAGQAFLRPDRPVVVGAGCRTPW
jgi:hypothetical protein